MRFRSHRTPKAAAPTASSKLQAARLLDLEESHQALAAELVSLKAQIGRIAELEQQAARVAALLQGLAPQSASSPGASTPKDAEPVQK